MWALLGPELLCYDLGACAFVGMVLEPCGLQGGVKVCMYIYI